MKFEHTDQFVSDFKSLPVGHREMFRSLVQDFHVAAQAYVADPDQFRWPAKLRVKPMVSARGVWEMTWSFSLDPPIEPSSAALESMLAALSSSHMPPACTRRLPCHPRTSTPSQNSPIGGSRLSGPDGRATFEFVTYEDGVRVRWRRIGTHSIYKQP